LVFCLCVLLLFPHLQGQLLNVFWCFACAFFSLLVQSSLFVHSLLLHSSRRLCVLLLFPRLPGSTTVLPVHFSCFIAEFWLSFYFFLARAELGWRIPFSLYFFCSNCVPCVFFGLHFVLAFFACLCAVCGVWWCRLSVCVCVSVCVYVCVVCCLCCACADFVLCAEVGCLTRPCRSAVLPPKGVGR
jgi:hypothetical protein